MSSSGATVATAGSTGSRVGLYRDQGVVLRSIRLGEADRIVSFITEGRGKVRAVAKGVRKTKSRFGARLEPTSHVSMLMYEGRELDIVTQVEALDHFRVIREDLERLSRATAMLEAVDQVVQERQPGTRLSGSIRSSTASATMPRYACRQEATLILASSSASASPARRTVHDMTAA